MERLPKLLFVVTEDWYFCSHRLPLAVAAGPAGFAVSVATQVNQEGERIRAAGLRLIPLILSRRGSNPFVEMRLIWRLFRLYREEKPDLIHHVAIKPVLYGSLAAWLARVPATVNALAGLGFIFSSTSRKARLLRPVVKSALGVLLNVGRGMLIVQNSDDQRLLIDSGLIERTRIRLIRGAGVNLKDFFPRPEPSGVPVVILASRLLWDKGVRVFVEAARVLREQGVGARFALVGAGDPENPSSVPETQLRAWHESGVVEWWGRRSDMAAVLSSAHIVCLPTTYGEGVPKILLEAAACGRAIVATDIPGCREIVSDGHNGILVPRGDIDALSKAIKRLLDDPALRKEMGQRGRHIVEREFSEERVIKETLAIYKELLA
jgi:glycosyltransferase involved in cell wall biosynthesis